jgi:hypothetical protein
MRETLAKNRDWKPADEEIELQQQDEDEQFKMIEENAS